MRRPLALLSVTLALQGCASVTPSTVCLNDGTVALPQLETRFISTKLEITCNAQDGKQNTVKLTLESSQWIWATIASIGAAAIMLVRDEAPALRPDELGPLELLEPKARDAQPEQVALDPRWTAPGALVCGGVAQPSWCYP